MRILIRIQHLTIEKIKRKIRGKLIHTTRKYKWFPYIYRSYWHYKFNKNNKPSRHTYDLYYTARPNPGAGIGHQMANWIAGYWFARQFGLKFAHIPFSTKEWDDFLSFGNGEPLVANLKRTGYKIRRLPLFNEQSQMEVDLNKLIIQSYAGQKIIFIAEQDQYYHNQYGVIDDIRRKFYSVHSKINDNLSYMPNNFNIAIHVRRGDIMEDLSNPGLAKRYLSNDYFEKVLKQVIEHTKTEKPIHIYFFSQGNPDDFPEFAIHENLHWCFDMGAKESFLHMVYADLLITSKSSFSYKPALLSKGIKVCPKNFWHGYPNTQDWVLVENDGTIIWSDITF